MSGSQSAAPVRILVDGCDETRVSALDRGLAYGDGLFETIHFDADRAPLWQRHMARLAEGCRRLRLEAPDAANLASECARVSAGMARAVVRITLTRGVGARGYAAASGITATRIVAAFAPPASRADWYARGMRVRLCATRLAAQPLLAGIKHLNRLEQVLARAEWEDPAIDEGLMCDHDGHVIGATAANLFAVIGGRLVTPPVDRCGVAGVMREELLARTPVVVRNIDREELHEAEEVFLTNALRGIVPVTHLDDRRWPIGVRARQLAALVRDMSPGPGVGA